MAWLEHRYDDGNALASAVTQWLHEATRAAIRHRGSALLALAGGRTPLQAYAGFAAQSLDWHSFTAMPTDERCVHDDDAASNIGVLRSLFAQCDGLRLESLTTPDGEPDASTQHARTMLARHDAPFDCVMLGMGADGHTASLFPGARQLATALDVRGAETALRIDPWPLPPEAPYPRITLTAARLLDTREIHLLATGDAKREVLARAYACVDPMQLPIAAFLHAPGALVHVHWSP